MVLFRPKNSARSLNSSISEQASETIAFVEDIEARGFNLKRFTADLIGLLKDSLIYDLASGTSLLSERKKEVIKKSLSPVPSWKRMSDA